MMLKVHQSLAGLLVTLALPLVDGFGFAGADCIDNCATGCPASVAQETPQSLPKPARGTSNATWAAPEPQSRGGRWIYDLFTPPDIYYEEASNQFKVAGGPQLPTAGESGENANEIQGSFGLQLKEVTHPLFRLQLIGFIKTAHAQLGLFENVETAEINVAPGGTVLPQLRLVIESLAVRAEEVGSPEQMPMLETRATAVVRDQVTGLLTRLTSAQRSFDPEPRATLVSIEFPDVVREVSEGDSVKVGEATYEVAEIRVSPPQVILMRRGATRGAAERHTLNLPEVNQPLAMTPST